MTGPVKAQYDWAYDPAGFTFTMGFVDTGAAHDASTNPAVGMIGYRSSDGFGTATVTDMRLQWSYADNGAGAVRTMHNGGRGVRSAP